MVKRSHGQHGFSLVEIGVVLMVLGVLSVGGVAYWRTAGQQRVTVAERDLLGRAEQAMLGFAHAQYRLPCPDTNSDGIEDCGVPGSINHVGGLPWLTLQLPEAAAAQFKFGVYRAPHVNAWLDTDLSVAKDRMRPLVPVASAGTVAAADLLLGSTNLLDFCAALTLASSAPATAASLAVMDSRITPAARRPMAFVIASPGLLDADGNGDRFDGLNSTASTALPTFEAANRNINDSYDDRLLAMGFDKMFAQLNCGPAMSAIGHSHFNASLSAAIMQLAISDHYAQLQVSVLLAAAGVASGVAGVSSAAAGLANAVAALSNATTFTVVTYGSTAGLIAAATAAVIVNTAALVASAAPLALAIAIAVETADRVAMANAALAPSAALALSVDANSRNADALGF